MTKALSEPHSLTTHSKQWVLVDSAATEWLAKQFSAVLSGPLVIGLSGEIGMGKTTFVRALLRALGYSAAVKSPTFSLVEAYELSDRPEIFYHFDWYRLTTAAELEAIGWRDYDTPMAICCVEWPDRIPSAMQAMDLQLTFEPEADGRLCTMVAKTASGISVLESLNK